MALPSSSASVKACFARKTTRSFAARAATPTITRRRPAMHALVLRSPHAHAKFTINTTRARGLPGVGAILTAEDVKELGGLPCLFNLEVDPFTGPPYADPGPRRGAPCRRCRCLRGRGHDRSGPRRDRGHRGQLDAAAGGGRRCQCRQEGRAAGLARACRQRAVRRADRRQEGDRGRVRQGPCGSRSIDRQSARHHQLHGNARGGLRIRRQAGSSDADDRQPGQPPAARYPVPERAEDAAREDAGDLPGCRRRIRHQAVSLSRICADRGRRAQAAQDRQMDRRPRRSFHGRRAGPRQRHHGADGAGRGRQVPGDGRRSDRRHGRLSVDLRALHSAWRRRHAARPLRHPDLPLPRPHGVHQHRAGRRLSRRRTPRGGLCDRAAGRCMPRENSAWRRTPSAARISSRRARCPTRPRPARSTIPATSPRI